MRRLGPGLGALALAAIAVAAPVHAADLPAAPSYYPPQAYKPALYDWTGIYVGGHIGGGLLQDNWTQTTTTPLLNAGTHSGIDPFALIGGAQMGVNYEIAPWVIGVEGSYTASSISGTALIPSTLAGFTVRETSNPQWLAAATGRFGYAADTYLIYLKGGIAWMHAEYTVEAVAAGVATTTTPLNQTRTGFVGGIGLEYGMTEQLSAKFEYDFYDFGTANFNFGVIAAGGFVMPTSIKSNVNAFLVGLNYRFNWSGRSPLAAAY